MRVWELGVWEFDMVEGVRRALEANSAAYDALHADLRAGMTEKDAYAIVAEAVDRVCGAEPHEFIGDFVGGARSGAIEGPATDYAFKSGDAFILDLSVRRGSVWSDTCRTFFFGEPSERQRNAYETVLECQRLGEGIVRAGVCCEDVKMEVEAFLSARGYGGPKPYMKPAFELGDKSRLDVGVICTLEPGLYFEGDFGIRVENDYLVGADGLMNLFDYPRELEFFVL